MGKFQYTILCQIKNGTPFYISTYDYLVLGMTMALYIIFQVLAVICF